MTQEAGGEFTAVTASASTDFLLPHKPHLLCQNTSLYIQNSLITNPQRMIIEHRCKEGIEESRRGLKAEQGHKTLCEPGSSSGQDWLLGGSGTCVLHGTACKNKTAKHSGNFPSSHKMWNQLQFHYCCLQKWCRRRDRWNLCMTTPFLLETTFRANKTLNLSFFFCAKQENVLFRNT